MVKKKETGITIPGRDDTTPKKFDEKMKALFEGYVRSKQMEEDFKNLKSSDRLQFIQKMTPYFIPKKDSESGKKKIVIGEPMTEEFKQALRKIEHADEIIPSDFEEEEWRGKTWGEYYDSL